MSKMLHSKALITKQNITEEEGVVAGVTGSTSVVDRMGDIIDQDGWNLTDYKNNPVILWGHNVKEERMPIGRAKKVWVEGKGKNAKLMFDIIFDLKDSFAAEVYRKIKDGFLNTVSVGFLPNKWIELDPDNWFGGLKYTDQDLLELSVVPVPANPKALMGMRSFAKKTGNENFEPVKTIEELYPKIETEEELKEILGDNKKDEEITADEEVIEEEETTPTEEENTEEVVEETTTETEETTEQVVDEDTGEVEEEVVTVETEEEKEVITPEVEEIRTVTELIVKAGRVLSSKNEAKIRQSLDLLNEVLEALGKEDAVEDDGTSTGGKENNFAKAVPFKSFGTLPESEAWDVVGEVTRSSIEDLSVMCAYIDSEEETPTEKTAYKLVHHKADDDHKAVWRGVTFAMAQLMGAKGGDAIAEEERKAVYDHLVEHYKEFGKEAPSFEMVEQQVLANLEDEVQAVALEREEKHVVRLVKKILDNQKEAKKATPPAPTATQEQAIKALQVLNSALTQLNDTNKKGGDN